MSFLAKNPRQRSEVGNLFQCRLQENYAVVWVVTLNWMESFDKKLITQIYWYVSCSGEFHVQFD